MNRFSIAELSFRRLYDAVERRIQDFPHAIAWGSGLSFPESNRSRLASFRNKHIGQRCFIIGNGPSLEGMDLDILRNEFTFGLNRIYLLFDRISFVPTYYVCINELVLEQFGHEIEILPMPKFLNWNRRNLFDQNANSTMFVKVGLGVFDSFARNLLRPVSSGGTVTYVALQIAYYMGFKEVVLIGVDHNFQASGTPNQTEIRSSTKDVNHFHPNYFPEGSKWQLPDLRRSELAYRIAKTVYEQDNRRILDATVGGKCTVFKKVKFEDLFVARS